MRVALAFLMVLIGSGYAIAQDATSQVEAFILKEKAYNASANRCGLTDFMSANQVGKIKSKTRFIYNGDAGFYHSGSTSDDPCPNENVKLCPQKHKINAEVPIIVSSKKARGFYCVHDMRKLASNENPDRRYGWVNEKEITFIPSKQSKISDWLGTWVGDWGGKIKIKETNSGVLHAIGYIEQVRFHEGDGSNITYTGEFDFETKPENEKIILTPEKSYDCGIELHRTGGYLFVTDNGHCGGMNVRFNDMYTKQ